MENKNAFKVTFIGPGGAGKKCIINRLLKNTFEDVGSSSGSSFCCKSITLEGHSFTIDIWDIIETKKYREEANFFYKDADGIFTVYDIANKNSFDDIDRSLA